MKFSKQEKFSAEDAAEIVAHIERDGGQSGDTFAVLQFDDGRIAGLQWYPDQAQPWGPEIFRVLSNI